MKRFLNLFQCGQGGEEPFAKSAAPFFLLDDVLAKFNTLPADGYFARAFDQWADVPLAFATERTVGVAPPPFTRGKGFFFLHRSTKDQPRLSLTAVPYARTSVT